MKFMRVSTQFPTIALILVAVLLSGLILASCSRTNNQPLPTSIPEEYLPTFIAQTAEAAFLLTQTSSPATPQAFQLTQEVETLGVPNQADQGMPAETVTPTAFVPEQIGEGFSPPEAIDNSTYPPAIIKIYRPGDLSIVTSPFRVVANVPPGLDGNVMVELLGEDGRTLTRKIIHVVPLPGLNTANLISDFDFETAAVAEAGRLQITVFDNYGRAYTVNSVNLILLSTGYSELKGYGDLRENIIIQQPLPNVTINGHTLLVSGLARTNDDRPLVIEVIDRNGRIITFGTAALVPSENGNYDQFVGEVSFSVNEPTPVRVIISARGARIPGTAFLSSLEVILSP
jgi:hypothetical protein